MTTVPVQVGFPRDVRAMTYLVSFLVFTVATVLSIRAVLAATGYPQLGGNGLHIAHAVWGGLVLAVGVVVLLSFIGPVVRPVAVVVCGIGFGLFLDEVGKFVTSTNNYFFRPAVAIMYVVTVLFVLGAQWLHGRQRPRPAELLAGAVNEAVSGASGISEARRSRALALVDEAGDQPGAAEAAALLRALPPSTREPGDPLIWLGDRVRRFGQPFARKRWLRIIVVTVLCINAAVTLLVVALAIVVEFFLPDSVKGNITLDVSPWAIAPAGISAVCVVVGIRYLHRDPGRGYAWFERALLVDLLLTQPLAVAADEFSALPSVLLDLIMLAVVATARAAADPTRAPGPARGAGHSEEKPGLATA
jgi:hypothetical protein